MRYGTAAGFAELRRLKSYHMYIDISNKPYLGKHEIFILDLLANNHWKRPIYYAVTVSSDSYMGLDRYFRLEDWLTASCLIRQADAAILISCITT